MVCSHSTVKKGIYAVMWDHPHRHYCICLVWITMRSCYKLWAVLDKSSDVERAPVEPLAQSPAELLSGTGVCHSRSSNFKATFPLLYWSDHLISIWEISSPEAQVFSNQHNEKSSNISAHICNIHMRRRFSFRPPAVSSICNVKICGQGPPSESPSPPGGTTSSVPFHKIIYPPSSFCFLENMHTHTQSWIYR